VLDALASELDAESRLLRSFGVTAFDEADALDLLREEFDRVGLEFPPSWKCGSTMTTGGAEPPWPVVPGDQPAPPSAVAASAAVA
jgi:hypothetical protein